MLEKLSVFIIAIVVSLGSLVGYQKFVLPKQIKLIYVVDTQKIIDIQKRKIYKEFSNNQNTQIVAQSMLKNLNRIEKIINKIAQRDNAIVLTKKAVISGKVKDITPLVLRIINENN